MNINQLSNDPLERGAYLVAQLNQWSKEYYENDNPTVTDAKWDSLYDELVELENKTGIVFADSPTQKVSGEPISCLKKVKHSSPMLSAKKDTDINVIKKFLGDKFFVQSYKEDGLTIVLRYDKGNLIQAITRGNGEEGEDVTHNFKHCHSIPQTIEYKNYLEVRGEAVISWKNFNKFNEANGGIYSHPRNLASGACRQLDYKEFEARNVDFLAFTLVNWKDVDTEIIGYFDSLVWLKSLGFKVVPVLIGTIKQIPELENNLLDRDNYEYPTDGWVFRFNDLEYGESLGRTGHHPNDMIALKPSIVTYKTRFRGIDYKVSRKGVVSLTAIFDEVNLDGAKTTRASVHNVDIFKAFQFGEGDEIEVYKANEIIPQVYDNLTRSNSYKLIDECPCCGKPLIITKASATSNANFLFCSNTDCSAKKLAQFNHFVSKPCMNIDGLSESTLDILLGEGLITTYKDIYHLKEHYDELIKLDRFGEKKVENLLASIEKSRNVKLENYLNALGIPNIGKSASRVISNYFHGDVNAFYRVMIDDFDFSQLEDFGLIMNDAIYDFFSDKNTNRWIFEDLLPELNFIKEEVNNSSKNKFIDGKTFVVTGKFETKTRSELEKIIVDRGGKLSGSVSKKTDYLLTNDAESGSSKAEKAKLLKIPIMNEKEFLEKL